MPWWLEGDSSIDFPRGYHIEIWGGRGQPGAGFMGTWGAMGVGLAAGILCALAVRLKFRFGYDDALDVVGVHLVGGIVHHHNTDVGTVGTALQEDQCFGALGEEPFGAVEQHVGLVTLGSPRLSCQGTLEFVRACAVEPI